MMCQKRKIQVVKYAQLHFSTPRLPMQIISMDLLAPLTLLVMGIHYALTVICMLTGYTFCIPSQGQDC